MRIKALTLRILNQLRHDKRTVALVIFAPLLILTLMYFILDSGNTTYQIGIVKAPEGFVSQLEATEHADIEIAQIKDAEAAVKDEKVTAAVEVSDDLQKITIYMDGTDSSKAAKIEMFVRSANAAALQETAKNQMAALWKKCFPHPSAVAKSSAGMFLVTVFWH